MPTTVVLRFRRGRYHAVPWGQQVTDGAVELPPSPWRVLRAFYAVWRTRAPELDDDTVRALLARLADPPTFQVPRHVLEHSVAVFERDAELGMQWSFELTFPQRAALERLAGSIPYFGRADSLCSGFLPTEWEPGSHDTWRPVDVAESVAENAVVTSVLAPDLPLRLDALLARPVDVGKDGLPFPAGTHLLAYQRRRALRPDSQPRGSGEVVTAVRFSVLQAGPPPQTDSLIYTDLLRQAALSRLGRLPEERTRTQLGGRTAEGEPMEGHGHAHYLPLITAARRLTGLVVWVPNELPDDELKALTAVDRLYSKVNLDWRLTIRVAGIGTPVQAAPELTAQRGAMVWQSVTPFTPSRYPKRNAGWLDYFRAEVSKELESRGLPPLRSMELLDEEWRSWRRYRPSARMQRKKGQGQATHPSAFLRIELAEPVQGPLALGHLSHFGLGLFVPWHGDRGPLL